MISLPDPDQISSERPFYLSFVLWGERFRNFFADYCVASLLAEGNLPAITKSRKVKVLIATTAEDWRALQNKPLMKRLDEFAESVFLEIPPAPSGRSGCEHMGVGHRLTTEMAFRDKAYLCGFVPDMVISDNAMTFLDRKAREGFHVVKCTSIRVMEEEFLPAVRASGLRPGVQLGDENAIIRLGAWKLVDITMANLHSQGASWNWDAPYFSSFPVAPFWPVPGGTAWVFHSLHWVPLLLDYSVIAGHDVTTFDNWTMDGDYIDKNFTAAAKIHIVTDSDEVMLESWAPASDQSVSLVCSFLNHLPFFAQASKIMSLHNTYWNSVFDSTKRRLFFTSIVWHSSDINTAKVEAVKNSAIKILNFCCASKNDPSLSNLSVRLPLLFLALISRFYNWWPRFITTQQERLQFVGYCIRTGQYALLRRKTRRRIKIVTVTYFSSLDRGYRRWRPRLILFWRLICRGHFSLILWVIKRRILVWIGLAPERPKNEIRKQS